MNQHKTVPNCNDVIILFTVILLALICGTAWFIWSYSNLTATNEQLQTQLTQAQQINLTNTAQLNQLKTQYADAEQSLHTAQQQIQLKLQQQIESNQQLQQTVRQAKSKQQQLQQQLNIASKQLQHQAQTQQTALREAKTLITQQRAQIEQLTQQINRYSSAQQQKADEIAQWQLEVKKLRQELAHTDIKISQLKDRFTVFEMNQNILFNAGDTRLTPSGQATLASLAKVFKQYPKRQIAIQGHTDDLPLGAKLKKKFHSNWELAAARAASAIYYLQYQAKINPQRMILVSYAQYRPKTKAKKAKARAQNRRIEIILMPKDFDFFRESGTL